MSAVYVTGATAGLGRAIASAFAGAGHSIGLIARDELALADFSASLGARSAWAPADVSDFRQLVEAAAEIESRIGPPDVWINNAMATIFSRFDDILPEEFARAIEVTLLGSVHGMQIALKSMKARGRGHIIQIGSALAYRAIPLQAPYCSAKLAVRGAVDSLRCELIHDRSPVRITMVHMPAMNTPQFDWARRHVAQRPQPVPPIFAPEACAKAVLWAAGHPDRREVWVGRPTFAAILGNKLVPALMDYLMARTAYESQFERPAGEEGATGNLFHPVPGHRRAEGRFASRQRDAVGWIGTSWQFEIGMIAAAVLALAVILYGLVR